MLRWMKRATEVEGRGPEIFKSVSDGLKELYKKHLRPLEEAYKFSDFHSPPLQDADFDSKPMVLLIGQYSVGKTTFIKYLLEQDFPGMKIGPEPTTDSFTAVMHGEKDKYTGTINEGILPGNVLAADTNKPFTALSSFGNVFLSRLQGSMVKNKILESISIIDTPGILSGEKHRLNRGYDFSKALAWLAERVDCIILLFDAHKLDISDEFHDALNAIKTFDSKIHVVLNKADQVNTQQLMRVYGALMWSLGKVINTPEVVRVYMGSFWNQPLHFDENRQLFEADKNDLFEAIEELPKNAALRKLNDLIKRTRLAKVHAYIIGHIHDNMPSLFGKNKAKNKIIQDLGKIYAEVAQRYSVSLGDFPNIEEMKTYLRNANFNKFPALNKSMIQKVDDLLGKDVPELLKLIQKEDTVTSENKSGSLYIEGGAFSTSKDNPFNNKYSAKFKENNVNKCGWVLSGKMLQYNEIFMKHQLSDGKLIASEAKKEMLKSKLPDTTLAKVWRLADCDKDGLFTEEEFALAMYLIDTKLRGHSLPDVLPKHLVPPSQRINVRTHPRPYTDSGLRNTVQDTLKTHKGEFKLIHIEMTLLNATSLEEFEDAIKKSCIASG